MTDTKTKQQPDKRPSFFGPLVVPFIMLAVMAAFGFWLIGSVAGAMQ